MLNMNIMASREIRIYPDPVLRNKTDRVEKIDSFSTDLLKIWSRPCTLRRVGLAANQVGVALQLAVIDLSSRENEEHRHPLLIIINPEILSMDGSITEEEGCLSIPDYAEKVKRAARVKVRAQDRMGKFFEVEAEGLLAKALQHEIDHLNGLLFVDHLSPLKKNIFKRRYKKMAAE